MSYRLSVADRAGWRESYTFGSFDGLLDKYAELIQGDRTNTAWVAQNDDRADGSWDGEHWNYNDGLTEEERERLEATDDAEQQRRDDYESAHAGEGCSWASCGMCGRCT